MSAAAVMELRRKRLVRRFREAGALDAHHAVTLESLGERRSWIFRQLVSHSVLLAAEGGRFFLDDQAAVAFLHQHRRRARIIGGVLLLVFLLLLAAGLLR